MPIVSFDRRGFLIRSRRITLIGARCEHTLLDRSSWAACLDNLRGSGFNTILTSAPWSFHEARRGQFSFKGSLDLARYLELCAESGLKVILRAGPNVGRPFPAGGLPGWLGVESEAGFHREADPDFISALSDWWRHLFSELARFQSTDEREGPLLGLQIEHEWRCGNEESGSIYFDELKRLVNEHGLDVPLFTANDLWQDVEGAIDIWSEHVDSRDLFSNTRQLLQVQPDAPGVVLLKGGSEHPDQVARALKSVIAAGGMPIVDDAVGGVHRATTASAGQSLHVIPGAFLGHDGSIVPESRNSIPLIRFAGSFSGLLSSFDPALDAPVANPDAVASALVARRGSASTALFLLGDQDQGSDHEVVLSDGRKLSFGADPLGTWPLVGVDLSGSGRLDYTSGSIVDFVGRRLIVLFGRAGSAIRIGINGRELECPVPDPDDPDPTIVEFEEYHLVVCNPLQARSVAVDPDGLLLGVLGVAADGVPVRDPAFASASRVDLDGRLSEIESRPPFRLTRSRRKLDWSACPLESCLDGTNPRYARTRTPRSMDSCGIDAGYGWYLLDLPESGSNGRQLRFPAGPYRFDLYLGARHLGTGGLGTPDGFDVRLPAPGSARQLAVLVELHGGRDSGNRQVEPAGIHRPIGQVTPFKDLSVKILRNQPLEEISSRRGFVPELESDSESSGIALEWTFTHRRKKVLVVSPGTRASGSWFLNDQYLRRTETSIEDGFRLVPGVTEGMKQGRNVLVFRPDPSFEDSIPDLAASLRMEEVLGELGTDPGSIAFTSVSAPSDLVDAFRELGPAGDATGIPTWFRVQLANGPGRAASLDLSSMSRGLVLVDGTMVGRYDAGTSPAVSLPPDLTVDSTRIEVFDVGGCDPRGITLSVASE